MNSNICTLRLGCGKIGGLLVSVVLARHSISKRSLANHLRRGIWYYTFVEFLEFTMKSLSQNDFYVNNMRGKFQGQKRNHKACVKFNDPMDVISM